MQAQAMEGFPPFNFNEATHTQLTTAKIDFASDIRKKKLGNEDGL